jgi:ABC-2 type transport system permease protein
MKMAEGRFGRELLGVYAVWWRELKVFQREKSRVVSSVASPLMWLFLFGGGVGSAISLGGGSYQSFIYPGVLVMAVLFSSVFFGLYIVWDRKLDVLKAVLVAPVSRVSIFFGKVLGGCTDVMIQAVLLSGFAVLFPGVNLWMIPVALGILFITSIAMVSLGLAIGSMFESLEGFQVVSTFLVFPLFFLSGALYPVGDNLPGWLQALVRLNPLTYAVDGVRGALLGLNTFPVWADVGAIAFFGVLMILLGTYLFSRMK